VRETVEVVVKEHDVEIWLRGHLIAHHMRCYEPHTWIRDESHFEGLFRSEEATTTPASSRWPICPMARPLSVYTDVVERGQPWTP
jgi:hypothetical protein